MSGGWPNSECSDLCAQRRFTEDPANEHKLYCVLMDFTFRARNKFAVNEFIKRRGKEVECVVENNSVENILTVL